jgi:hypothetical protein
MPQVSSSHSDVGHTTYPPWAAELRLLVEGNLIEDSRGITATLLPDAVTADVELRLGSSLTLENYTESYKAELLMLCMYIMLQVEFLSLFRPHYPSSPS